MDPGSGEPGARANAEAVHIAEVHGEIAGWGDREPAARRTELQLDTSLNIWVTVMAIDEKVEPLDLDQDVDLVGISALTTTVQRGYEIADHFRRRGIKVVMGGMHVLCLPDEALQHCDSVVVGEAEVLWPALLRDFQENALKPVYRHGDELPHRAFAGAGLGIPPEELPADPHG